MTLPRMNTLMNEPIMSETVRYPIVRSEPPAPPAIVAKLRLQGPLAKVQLWDGSSAWVVTRYKDVRAVLLDKRFSESPKSPGYPTTSPARKALVTGDSMMPQTQGEHHLRLRRVLTRVLSVKRVEAQRPKVREVANRLIDAMIADGGPANLVTKFALRVPMITISGMLGIPDKDHEFLQEKSRARIRLDVAPHVPLEATRAMAEYFTRLLEERALNPSDADDILSIFARDQIANGELTLAEAVNLAYQLVQGGHETTANTIALGTLQLLQNPDQLQALIKDPTLAKSAVEEMLRYQTVVQHSIARVAVEDAQVGGEWVRKGEGVFALLVAADHDPEAFPEPQRFNIQRTERNHLAFGFGVHQCIGQQLARLELQEVFSLLFRRLPTLKLAVPFEQLKFRGMETNFGVEELPVIW
jgi:cytochrome P450